MGSPARRRFTFRDYLDLEEASNTKHEYHAGEIHAMAGGTPEHAALSMSVGAALLAAARGGPCRVYSSDLRVRVLDTGLAAYPDVTVLCGPPEHDPDSPTTVTNPTIIVEVLSPGTEQYDREEKVDHYRRIPSLRACLLVAHDRRHVEVWSRGGSGWERHEHGPGGVIPIPAVDASLDVDAVYDVAGVAG